MRPPAPHLLESVSVVANEVAHERMYVSDSLMHQLLDHALAHGLQWAGWPTVSALPVEDFDRHTNTTRVQAQVWAVPA